MLQRLKHLAPSLDSLNHMAGPLRFKLILAGEFLGWSHVLHSSFIMWGSCDIDLF